MHSKSHSFFVNADSVVPHSMTTAPMERIVKRVQKRQKRQQQASDLAFWLPRPMAERIAAVETLRVQASTLLEPPHAEPRLQRVCRITQRQGR